MPKLIPQEEKAQSTINAQPKSIEKNSVQLILLYDLSGWKQGRIAEELGMTQSRVSVIMSSPLYKAERQKRFEEMQSSLVEKKAEKAEVGDPVTKAFKDRAVEMANKKIDLALNGKSEFVQNSATSECLAMAGYAPQKTEKKSTNASILVSEKVAQRFERVLGMKLEITETKTITGDNDSDAA